VNGSLDHGIGVRIPASQPIPNLRVFSQQFSASLSKNVGSDIFECHFDRRGGSVAQKPSPDFLSEPLRRQ